MQFCIWVLVLLWSRAACTMLTSAHGLQDPQVEVTRRDQYALIHGRNRITRMALEQLQRELHVPVSDEDYGIETKAPPQMPSATHGPVLFGTPPRHAPGSPSGPRSRKKPPASQQQSIP